MTASREVRFFFTATLRWFARLVGLLAIVPVVLFILHLSGTIPQLPWGQPHGMPLFIALLTATVSVLLAWRWEMVCGMVAAASALVIGVLAYLGSGAEILPTALLASVPFLIAGLLFMACCWSGKRCKLSAGE